MKGFKFIKEYSQHVKWNKNKSLLQFLFCYILSTTKIQKNYKSESIPGGHLLGYLIAKEI